jgi:hypothetical protein
MDNIAALAGLRTTIGVSAWAAPDFSARLFGLDPDANPQGAYLGRLFAVRDLVLGIGTLTAEPPARKLWLQAGVACDVADAAAALLGRRNGYLPVFATVATTAAAISAVAMGVAALGREETAAPAT